LIYGDAGVGKTVFAASAQDHPDGKNVIIIDIEGGTRSISDRADIDIFQPKNWTELRNMFDWLANGKDHGYQTVVIDSLTEAQQLGLRDLVAQGSTPELQQWGKSNEQVQSLARNYKSLAQIRGFNVIFTARVAEIKNEQTGVVLRRPMLTPKAADAVVGIVDAVGFMEMHPRTRLRTLRFGAMNSTWAKVRQPASNAKLPLAVENPTMSLLLDLLNGTQKAEDLPDPDANTSTPVQ
jgi:phage nucleotide-binding protein